MLLPRPCRYTGSAHYPLLLGALCLLGTVAALGPARAEAPAPGLLRALVRPVEGDTTAPPENAATQLRGKHSFLVLAAGNARPRLLLRSVTINKRPDPLNYCAIGPSGRVAVQGAVAPGKEKMITLAPGARCILRLDSGPNAATVRVDGGSAGLLASAESPLHLYEQAGRLYFLVPRGTKAFTLSLRGGGARQQASVQVFTPSGKAAGMAATGPDNEAALPVVVDGADAGGIWSLVVSRGEQGSLEDAYLWLSADVPTYLAESPQGLALPFISYTAKGALYQGDRTHRVVLDASINLPPQPDRLVRAAMSRAGSGRTIWATQPAPFTGGRVRVVLPEGMAPGTYDLKTALLDQRTRLTGSHVQRVVVTPQFVYVGEPVPLLRILSGVETANAAEAAPMRAGFALDPSSLDSLGVRVAVTREGETTPAAQQDLGRPELPAMALKLPTGTPNGFCRVVASLTDAAGTVLGSAGTGAFLQGGQIFAELPPPAPRQKAVLLSSQRQRGYVLFSRDYPEAFPYNYEPPRAEIGRPLSLWATPGEYEPATFGVYALRPLKEVRVSVSALERQGGAGKIDPSQVEVRLARLWPQRTDWTSSRYRVIPELLEQVPSASLPTGRVSQYWLTLLVPDKTPAGDYRGTVTFKPANAPASSLKLLLKVLPFRLAKPAARTWGLHADSERWRGWSPEEILREMRDMRAHGIDSLGLNVLAHGSLRYQNGKLAVDFTPLSQLMALYRKAGLRGPVVLDLRELPAALAGLRGRKNPPHDAEEERLYLVVLSALSVRATAESWPEIACQVAGETPSQSLPPLATMRAELALVKRAGLTTFCAIHDPAIAGPEWDSLVDIWCYPAHQALEDRVSADALLKQHVILHKPFWWSGSGCDTAGDGQEGRLLANRYLAGVGFWRTGAAGEWSWTFQHPTGDPFNDFDGENGSALKDACITYPEPGTHASIPTLQWEGLREGIDDARYLYTFQQMMEKGKRSGNARAVAYGKKVEREAQAMLDRIAWGATPEAISSYELYAQRKMLAKYMGTMLNKLGAGAATQPAPKRHAHNAQPHRAAVMHAQAAPKPSKHTESGHATASKGSHRHTAAKPSTRARKKATPSRSERHKPKAAARSHSSAHKKAKKRH